MQISEQYRRCVLFIGYLSANQLRMAATGFVVTYPLEKSGERATFIVTAKHVIESIKEKEYPEGWDQPVLLRFNMKLQSPAVQLKDPKFRREGLVLASAGCEEWFYHPTDPAVDVAVLPRMGPSDRELFPNAIFDYTGIPIELFATLEHLTLEQAGPGDDIFVVGLFRNHFGTETNEVITRVGNVASMPREKVKTRMGDAEMYLIEARSLGGLSGSPVFLHLGGERVRIQPNGLAFPSTQPMKAYLFGLIHGHWDIDEAGVDVAVDDVSGGRINQGVAMVVPSRKIKEVIEQPVLLAKMRELDESIVARQNQSRGTSNT